MIKETTIELTVNLINYENLKMSATGDNIEELREYLIDQLNNFGTMDDVVRGCIDSYIKRVLSKPEETISCGVCEGRDTNLCEVCSEDKECNTSNLNAATGKPMNEDQLGFKKAIEVAEKQDTFKTQEEFKKYNESECPNPNPEIESAHTNSESKSETGQALKNLKEGQEKIKKAEQFSTKPKTPKPKNVEWNPTPESVQNIVKTAVTNAEQNGKDLIESAKDIKFGPNIHDNKKGYGNEKPKQSPKNDCKHKTGNGLCTYNEDRRAYPIWCTREQNELPDMCRNYGKINWANLGVAASQINNVPIVISNTEPAYCKCGAELTNTDLRLSDLLGIEPSCKECRDKIRGKE